MGSHQSDKTNRETTQTKQTDRVSDFIKLDQKYVIVEAVPYTLLDYTSPNTRMGNNTRTQRLHAGS